MMNPNKLSKKYRRVLTIAGSDSGGGAGIQADLKTFAANGCYGFSVLTALTAQNTQGVTAIHAVPANFVEAQMDAVLTDIGADAIKIGMLFSAELIEVVARRLKKHGTSNVVLDPVMVAQSGDKLLQDNAIAAIKEHLIPLADIITPNVPEAEVFLGRKIDDTSCMAEAARDLARFGCQSVLVKGGHLAENCSTDFLYMTPKNRLIEYTAEQVDTINNHGTGCTLSSAIAAQLAHGYDIQTAVGKAKDYITAAIKTGAHYVLGKGNGPVHHFYKFWS
jgi:hydroxymethylpyrimidine/phosphomethylpyrimidine kinase